MPAFPLAPDHDGEAATTGPAATGRAGAESSLYLPIRNTLAAVIVLFAVYLVFEFSTLWFHTFPKGFSYSGYAHQGAAWLTVALALASGVLSAAFRAEINTDPRVGLLRRLAWIWSTENFLLAVAVYHRLHIYIDYNGMSRLRTVGLFGTTAVVVGLALVVRNVALNRGLVWLIHRQFWAVAILAYLFAVTPVDYLVHTYNVGRVLSGDPAPMVQIARQTLRIEGLLALLPLIHAQDPVIREGVRALLVARLVELDLVAGTRAKTQGWTAYQIAEQRLRDRLIGTWADLSPYSDANPRAAALERFRGGWNQWY